MSDFTVFYQPPKEIRAVNRLGNIVSGYVFYNMVVSVICVEKAFVQPLDKNTAKPCNELMWYLSSI